jgi:hypothetical protein
MKNVVFWDVRPCSSCVNRLLEERIASIIRVKRIVALGMLAVTSSNIIFLPGKHPRRHYSSTLYSIPLW